MTLHHDKETDPLYIDLAAAASSDTREISDEIVLDCDERGHLVGMDIH